jgi:pimeloyl-ACP methyl ester carboxylesterase
MEAPMNMLVAVDGTDSKEWRTGEENSHVLRFHHSYRGRKLSTDDMTHGPETLGRDVPDIVRRVTAEVDQAYVDGVRVFDMVGHSRGGHIVLLIAKHLLDAQLNGAQVRFMGLFDAVDRSLKTENTKRVPANVAICRHAVRARGTLNRNWFQNTGREHGPETNYEERIFWASHGSMGGDPAQRWSIGAHEPGQGIWRAAKGLLAGPNTLLTPPFLDQFLTSYVWAWMRGEAVKAGVPV